MELCGFGYKTAWLAMRAAPSPKVLEILGLLPGLECEWNEGVAASYGRGSPQVYLTPSIDGWTFLVGHHLFALLDARTFASRVEACGRALDAEVQFFATYRVVDAHAWARFVPGQPVRAYGHDGSRGETFMDLGALSAEEESLGFGRFGDRADGSGVYPNEEDVTQLAGRWSIDPTTFDGRASAVGVGLLLTPMTSPSSPDRASLPQPGLQPRAWWKLW